MEGQKILEDSLIIKNIELKKIGNNGIPDRLFFLADILNKKELFIHGGCNNFREIGIINILDFKNFEFKNLNDISREYSYLFFDKALHGHKSVNIDLQGQDSILVYGGFDGKKYSNQVYLIKTDDFKWDSANFSSCEYPLGRCYHSMDYDEENSTVYIFGGWDSNIMNFRGDNFSSLWEYKILNSLSNKKKF